MKLKNKITTIVNFLLVTIVLLATSCVDGFKETEVFSSSVRNTTLRSPDSLVFTQDSKGSTVTVSWPVVYGAGGYKVSLYIVDDPTNPVAVGALNQIVDGDTIQRPLKSETKYKAFVQTLGNAAYNNKDAVDTTKKAYSTYTVSYATIPSGTDLYTYFQTNPVPSSTTTILYDLEQNGSYTMSGNVSLGLTSVYFRGDKVHHPKITMSNGVFISDGAGLVLNRIDFDCSSFTGSGLITFNSTLNPSATTCTWGTLVNPLVSLQSCKIVGLASPLVYDNGKKYALQTLLINDCVIGQNVASKNLISMGGGYVKDLTISNSTIYNVQLATGGYLIQYANSTNASKITGANWATGSVSLTSSTFWQVCPNNAITNYSGFSSSASNTLNLQNNIFVDCDKVKSISASMCVNSKTPARNYANNTYWVTSGTTVTTTASKLPPGCPLYEILSTTYSFADNSGTVIQSDPQFQDPVNANFKVLGTAQIAAKTGDPRWLQ
jgi:hypothetical protein